MGQGNSRQTLVTQAAYARHRAERGLPGATRKSVTKAIQDGRILLINGLIDPAVADIQWSQNTRARTGSPKPAGHVSTAPAEAANAAPGDRQAGRPSPGDSSGYTAARARREQAEAETAEIQLAKLRGELCSTSDVARAGFEAARELRDAMESSVNSLASEVAGLLSADACAHVLRRHNRAIQELLAKSLREKIGIAQRLQ